MAGGLEAVKRIITTNKKAWNMKAHAKIASVLVVVSGVMLTTSALAQVYVSSDTLPPGPPLEYLGQNLVNFESAGLTNAGYSVISLASENHFPQAILSEGMDGDNWVETFDSTLTATVTITTLTGQTIPGNLYAAGATTVTIYNSEGPPSYDTGLPLTTSLSIVNWAAATVTTPGGSMPVYLQCPSAPGQTTVTPSGDGFLISSYFDVTPEISLDGENWITADEAVTMTLVPEPSGLALFGLTVLGLAIQARRGRK
jgi:hypothetical protein